ncbi:hypothetical protein JHC43_02485 [Marinobacter salarius]|jgi:hypothetical protein|uniref:toxin VasX n=2 Tax=Marinobacter TaxID=2742 RepID=UPI0018F20A24|nr:toxin VasX [Marinobacter salarius]MBJ7275325.1 hypothetical protein [Marinobacter salarius]
MNQPLNLKREPLDKTVRLRAENDKGEPAGMVLAIPTQEGGSFMVPVLDDWQSTEEKPEGELGNTLMSICPVAEVHSKRPIESGGVTIFGGRAVSLMRPGYLYVFRGQTLWREFDIGPEGTLCEVDLTTARQDKAAARLPVGKPVTDFLVPVFMQNRFELSECRIAYSEIQWPWSYIEKLESSPALLEKRALSIAPAWAAATDDSLNFDNGFPASAITSVPALRPRDLGIELMLQDSFRFTPEFQRPDSSELASRLIQRWARIPDDKEGSDNPPPDLTLEAEPADDALTNAREHSAIVCVAIPDPLFRLRHALAQLHLALHYLDAIDLSLKNRPLIHSATLIRQALFDPQTPASDDRVETLRAAVDREKLHKTLDQNERAKVLEDITVHLDTLESLVNSGEFDAACSDYLNHNDLGPCEAFALQADLLNLTQQLPGVLNAHGLDAPPILTRLLKQSLGKNTLIAAMADGANSELPPLLAQLKELAGDQNTLTEERLNGVGLSSISALAQQLKQEEDDSTGDSSSPVPGSAAGTAAGMVQAALGGWSTAVLKGVEGLRQSGDLLAIKLDRVFTSVKEAAEVADRNLRGELRVMRRGEVDVTRYSMVGVHGKGLSFGLTDADLQSEALTRRNDYLFADRTDAAGNRVASTSPSRLIDEGGETLVKAAAHTWVFVLPIDHPEARKFSALKIDWANKAKAFADGPGLSRVLVGLAAYNLVSEMWSWRTLKPGEQGISYVKSVGAALDLSAALMKLHVVSSPADGKLVAKVILRPLFEIKSVPLIGPFIQRRLLKVGADTIARTMGLVNFFAGGVMVGVSAWDCRNSLSRGDMDAALGHGLAVAGGSVFLASPLMAGLLAVPGWGWALLGLGAVLGGSVFAIVATDSEVERVLKQGPLGLGPAHEGLPANDAVYYPQLLSQLSPVTVSAERYGNLSGAEQAAFADHNPSPDDYRVTVRSPLISRFKLGQPTEGKAKDKNRKPDLRLGIQELEYTHSVMDTPAGQVDEYYLARNTPLKKVTTWVPVPADHAVHFLVERHLAGGETHAFGHSERRTISLRVVLQARIESEIGSFRVPMPVLDDYEAFDTSRHSVLPDKQPQALNPFDNEPVPYWTVKEVAV